MKPAPSAPQEAIPQKELHFMLQILYEQNLISMLEYTKALQQLQESNGKA